MTIDISSRAFWDQAMDQRDRAFAALRAEPDPSFHPPIELGTSGGSGFWAAVTNEDIQFVSRHPERFCSGRGVGFSDIPAELNEPFGSFLMTDAPRHTYLRGLISRAFSPRRIRQIEDQIQRQASEIVSDALRRSSCELVADLSMRLPLWTISEMLGIPEERRRELREAANLMVGAQTPEALERFDDPFTAVLTAGITLSTLGSEIAAERRGDPRDDLMTDLVQAEVEGTRLTDEEIGAFVVLLGVAGNDTTRNSITLGVKAFADHPDQWELLRSNPELHLPAAVEEIVRWASPVLTFRRTATRDTEIGDRPIAEGDHVVLFYGSGNRDERVFDAPWTFDITRHPNNHVGFGGGGPHFCLGANLARTQLRSVFRELATRVTAFEVGEPDFVLSAFVHGVEAMDCKFATTS